MLAAMSIVSIRKGAEVLWQQTILNGNTSGFAYDITVAVATGEQINFVINRRANYDCDSTNFDPTIVYTSGSATVHWLVTDQLGTPRMIIDQSGSLQNVSRHDYLPFGEELFAGTGGRTAAQGYTANDNVRQKFTSKERDGETGLDYFLARYYSATLARFLSTDPILISQQRVEDPQRLNLYGYTRGNPLKYTDPNGEDIVLDPSLSNEQRQRLQEAVTRLRSQSKAADKAFAVFDPKPGGGGPNLTITVLDDATFKGQTQDADKACALTTPDGGEKDSSGNYLVAHARISFRESSLSSENLENEGKDRADGRETFLEGVLSHEVGHARDRAVDPKGTEDRHDADKTKDYYDRRNEIRADDMLSSIRAERFFKGYVGVRFQPGLKFDRKEIPILRQRKP